MAKPFVILLALGASTGLGMLSGCMTPLRQKPAVAVDLSGHWILDRTESETAESAMRPRMGSTDMPASGGTSGGGRRGGGGGRRGGGGGGGRGGARGGGSMPGGEADSAGGVAGGGMNPSSLNKLIEWLGPTLVVSQDVGSIQLVSNGVTSRFRSGHHGCDAQNYVPEPDTTLKCGWDKGMWVLETHPKQRGQTVMQMLYLSEDKKRLMQEISVSGGPRGSLSIHRVYNAGP
jgi:hypothetical protein